METSLKTQKREILERGIRSILEESSVPQRMHLKMVRGLKTQIEEYKTSLSDLAKDVESERTNHKSYVDSKSSEIDSLLAQVGEIVSVMENEIDRLTTIEHLKGEPGKDAEPVDFNAIISALKPLIPAAVEGKRGKPGKDATLDTEKLVIELVEKIRKEKLLEITDIRNAESFIFNKKKYKTEELMHGSGGSGGSTANILTQYTLTATQDGADAVVDLSQLTNYATLVGVIVAYRNQIPQTNGNTCLISATDVRFYNADASEIFSITYTYA